MSYDSGKFRLYDTSSLLAMDAKVASGYVVLMGGFPTAIKQPSRKKRFGDFEEPSVELDKGALMVAFMALTDGNVIDACFGVKQYKKANQLESRSARCAQLARDQVSSAARSSESVRKLAVQAYGNAFNVVLGYNEQMKKLNIITRCFKSGTLYREAEFQIRNAFRPLAEAVDAAT